MKTLSKSQKISMYIKRYICLIIGTFLIAFGLEEFFLNEQLKNTLLDGGITGISIILQSMTNIPLGIWLIILNIPFVIIGYKQIGKTFAISTVFSIAMLAFFTTFIHDFIEPVTTDMFLSAIIGAILIGFGLGLVVRVGGSTDGVDIIAILISKKTSFSVGEIIMFINLFIFTIGGIIEYSWESSLYSMIAYYIAAKTMDIVIEGIDESKSVTIISDHYEEIADAIMHRLGRGVTYIKAQGAFTKEDKIVLYVIVTKLEITKLKLIVHEFDPDNALIAIEHVTEVAGANFKKTNIH